MVYIKGQQTELVFAKNDIYIFKGCKNKEENLCAPQSLSEKVYQQWSTLKTIKKKNPKTKKESKTFSHDLLN